MALVLTFTFLFAGLFFILGSYRIHVRIVSRDNAISLSVSLLGMARWIGIAWSDEENGLRPIVLGRLIHGRRKRKKQSRESAQKDVRKKSKSKDKSWPLHVYGRMGGELSAWVRHFFRLFRVDRLNVSGTFGLGDPARTGRAFGWLSAMHQVGDCCRIEVSPDFQRTIFEGEADLNVRFVMARLIWFILYVSTKTGWIYMTCRA